MKETLFTPITWPDIQNYMDIEGFKENSYLINDDKGMEEFGSSAYFVSCSWLLEADKKMLKEIFDDMLADQAIDELKNQ